MTFLEHRDTAAAGHVAEAAAGVTLLVSADPDLVLEVERFAAAAGAALRTTASRAG